jgi:putative radical SAM enzyme (TIGR03279 family)
VIRVQSVAPDGLGAALGLRPGTELLSVNGRALDDFLDWEFLTADDAFVLYARLPGGDEVEYEVERPEGLPLGVALEPLRIRRCANHCDFCFVDGNPMGLRRALYVRDDDYRFSFRYGGFATLTNLKPRDVARIIEYRLSPLYVSVHATDPVVRRWLLRNPEAPAIVPQLRELGAGGIRFHTQVVLVPGVNDGAVLESTLSDLRDLGDAILSVSVVPVALTSHSKLGLVRTQTREECRAAVAAVDRWSARAVVERGRPWCYGADELYVRAELPLPPAAWYGDFEQRENGVGAVRWLETRIASAGDGLEDLSGRHVLVVTGTAMAPLFPPVLTRLATATGGRFEVVPVENPVFGPSVTTAGLLPGAAVRAALVERSDADLALVPAEAVNDDLLFIDDLDAHDLAAALPLPVRLSYDFVDALGHDAPPIAAGASPDGGALALETGYRIRPHGVREGSV